MFNFSWALVVNQKNLGVFFPVDHLNKRELHGFLSTIFLKVRDFPKTSWFPKVWQKLVWFVGRVGWKQIYLVGGFKLCFMFTPIFWGEDFSNLTKAHIFSEWGWLKQPLTNPDKPSNMCVTFFVALGPGVGVGPDLNQPTNQPNPPWTGPSDRG